MIQVKECASNIRKNIDESNTAGGAPGDGLPLLSFQWRNGWRKGTFSLLCPCLLHGGEEGFQVLHG
ncbi:MAG: hypothetical protein WBH56_17110, partial [Bacteroidota bacterium]